MIRKFLLVLSALAILAQPILADCVLRHRQVAVAPVVVATPAAVVVPAYGATYDATAVELPRLRERIVALETLVQSLEKRAAALEGKTPAPPAPPGPPGPKPDPFAAGNKAAAKLPALYARSCIQCHKQGGKTSGGLVLVTADGKIAALTCEQKLAVLRRINLKPDDAKVMPPKKSGHEPASDDEFAEVFDLLTR